MCIRALATSTVVMTGLTCVLAAAAPSSQPAGNEVTLICNVLSNVHTGEKDKAVFVIAYDGTPEIRAELEKVMAEYPDKGLDADTAMKIQDLFMTRLRYNVDGSLVDKMHKEAMWSVRMAMAVTGVISVRDGKKWITASKWEATKNFTPPAKWLAPDKPFVMPDKDPLVIKISDSLSYACIHIPPGKFVMGEPYYQCMHWQEDPPHMVTLTKGCYMAEHPVTQEIYEAVMGENPEPGEKNAKLPVRNVDCAHMYKFCELLSAKIGRTVRIPTAAEWEYAARVGTSNPTYASKYAEQTSNGDKAYGGGPLPVKSRKPNPWGFYDMHSGGWERVSDAPVVERTDAVDPVHIPPQDKDPDKRSVAHKHFGKGQWTYPISEVEFIGSGPGARFRIVVETGDTTTAPATRPATAPAK